MLKFLVWFMLFTLSKDMHSVVRLLGHLLGFFGLGNRLSDGETGKKSFLLFSRQNILSSEWLEEFLGILLISSEQR